MLKRYKKNRPLLELLFKRIVCADYTTPSKTRMDLSQSGVVHPQNKRQKVALENSAPPADIKRYYESYSEGETVTAESTGNYTPEDDVINSPETMRCHNLQNP